MEKNDLLKDEEHSKRIDSLVKEYPLLKEVKQEILENIKLYYAFKKFDIYIKDIEDTIYLQTRETRQMIHILYGNTKEKKKHIFENLESFIDRRKEITEQIKSIYDNLQPKPL